MLFFLFSIYKMPTYLNIPNVTTSASSNTSSSSNTCMEIYNHMKDCPVCMNAYNIKDKFPATYQTRLTDKWPVFFNEIYISPTIIILIITFIVLIFFVWSKRT